MTAANASHAAELIDSLRATRADTLYRFAELAPRYLEDPHDWRGAPFNLRFRLSWLSEGSETVRIRAYGIGYELGHPRLTDAQRILTITGETRGRLLGTFLGVPDELFEQQPADGEWSLRRVLGHVIATDERYRIAIEHAAERERGGGVGPMRPSDASLPPASGEAQSGGTPVELLRRLHAARDTAIERILDTPDERLGAPTVWGRWDVDVRFRLHRFAAHDREHTIQIRKTLHALGFLPSEPSLLLADAQAALGALEVTLAAIGDAYLEREPPSGGPSVRQLVEQLLADEREI
jgi:uncharacterized damage-inducible protein DinB